MLHLLEQLMFNKIMVIFGIFGIFGLFWAFLIVKEATNLNSKQKPSDLVQSESHIFLNTIFPSNNLPKLGHFRIKQNFEKRPKYKMEKNETHSCKISQHTKNTLTFKYIG